MENMEIERMDNGYQHMNYIIGQLVKAMSWYYIGLYEEFYIPEYDETVENGCNLIRNHQALMLEIHRIRQDYVVSDREIVALYVAVKHSKYRDWILKYL